MNHNRILILTLGLVLVLACSVSTGAPSQSGQQVEPAQQQQPTQAPLPTYTPYPTYTPAPLPTLEPTATVPPTPAVKILYNAIKIEPGDEVKGDSKNQMEAWYFIGTAGAKITIEMSGYYPTFHVRDQNDEGLIGCSPVSNYTCTLTNFELPSDGVYYILTEPRAKTKTGFVWNWSGGGGYKNTTDVQFLGGPFNLTFQLTP